MSEKKLQDYLHFYLGCEVFWGDETSPHSGTLVGMNGINTKNNYRAEIRIKQTAENSYYSITPLVSQCKIILRPLSDMTEEEVKWVYRKIHTHPLSYEAKRAIEHLVIRISEGTLGTDAELYFYLLGQRFDLFGLIEAGLAIDKTKITSSI